MKTKLVILLLGVLSVFYTRGQNKTGLLSNFSDPALFDLNNTSCLDISGEWQGEESEYLDEFKTLKGKYSCKFVLNQQGNKVEGYTLITFDNGQAFGKMKIRGMVLGNKFHFEEYEILEQGFAKPGVLWCLRGGELNIRRSGDQVLLEGNNYKGYADQYYFDCQGKIRMDLSKNAQASDDLSKPIQREGEGDLQLRPNPAGHEVTVLFKLVQEQEVQIDMLTLAGKFVAKITREHYEAGTHQRLFDLAPFPAGVYLIRMSAGKESAASLLVIQR